MTYQSLAIAFAVIGTQAAQLTSLTNTWTAGLAQLEDEKIDAIAEQIGGLSVDEVVAELEGLFAQAEAEAEDSFDDFMDFAQHEADDEAELAQLSAEDTFEDIMDVGLDVAGAAFDIFAQLEDDYQLDAPIIIPHPYSWWLAQLDAEAMVDDEEDDYSENLFQFKYFPQVEDEKIDAIANQVGALSIDEVAAEIESWLAQLEDEKIDAIADQVGALSVDEVVAGLEGLFAQLSAEDVDAIAKEIGALSVDEVASALAQTEGWTDSLSSIWDKTKAYASDAYDTTAEYASKAVNQFPQLEADVEQWGRYGHFNGDCSKISCSNLSYKCATKDITLGEIMALQECCYMPCGGSSRHHTGH